jgi:structure-specific recognition protein 1
MYIVCFEFMRHTTDERFFRMRGQKYDYKIKYDDISRLFLLPKPDDVHMAFVIALDKPIRQGQQRYQHLVLQTTKDPDEVTVNLDEETMKREYGEDLQPVMRGSLANLVAKTFKVIAKKKVRSCRLQIMSCLFRTLSQNTLVYLL